MAVVASIIAGMIVLVAAFAWTRLSRRARLALLAVVGIPTVLLIAVFSSPLRGWIDDSREAKRDEAYMTDLCQRAPWNSNCANWKPGAKAGLR